MLLGLTNAAGTFQRAADITFVRQKWQTYLVYLGDIIIFSQDFEYHKRHVAEIMSVLKESGLSLKLRK